MTQTISNNNEFDKDLKQIHGLIEIVEKNLKNCKIKFKAKNEIEALYSYLTNSINENFNEQKIIEHIIAIENNLKKQNKLTNTYKNQTDDLKKFVKNVSIDVRSIRTMLEKSLNIWTEYHDSYDALNKWLADKQAKSSLDKDELHEYSTYKTYHVQFTESINYLLSISDSQTCDNLKQTQLYINKRWAKLLEILENTDGKNLALYLELENGCNKIHDWLIKIETLIETKYRCDIQTIDKYEDEIIDLYGKADKFETNIVDLFKLAGRLYNDRNFDIDYFYNDLERSKAKLVSLKTIMPSYLENLKQLNIQLNAIDNFLKLIENWMCDAEVILKLQPDQLNYDKITKQLEKYKKQYAEFEQQENNLKACFDMLEDIKVATPSNFDTSNIEDNVTKIEENINDLLKKGTEWENSFKLHHASWKTFYARTKQLEEWILGAQKIVLETNEDLNYLIQKHKQFFDHIDHEILHGFLDAGDDLLKIKTETNKLEIRTLMETLEGKWQMIVSHAPVRLMKLNFKRLENLLKEEITAADKEITEEGLALNQNQDISEILRRHEAKFKYSDFYKTCESYLQGLRNFTNELISQKVEDKSIIENSFDHMQKYWDGLMHKIDKMNEKLKTLPDTKETFDKNLHQLSTWLIDLEQNKRQINNNDLSVTEYKRLIDKLKLSLNDVDDKRDTMTNLNTLYNYLSNEVALKNTYQIELLKTQEKFTNIIKNVKKIQDRLNYLEICISACYDLDIITTEIREITTNSTRKFLSEEEECSIQTAIDEQNNILEKLNKYLIEVKQLSDKLQACILQNGRLPSVLNEKLTNAQEMLRQSLNEETDRMSSLTLIQMTDEEKKSKLNTLNANIQQIEKTLRHDRTKIELFTDEPRSVQDERRSVMDDANGEEYMNSLEICKNLLNYSKQLLIDLKNPVSTQEEFDALYEIEIKLENYETEIDTKLNEIREFVLKNKRLNEKIDEITSRLNKLKEDQELSQLDNSLFNDTLKQTKFDFNEINSLNSQLLQLFNEFKDKDKTNSYLQHLNIVEQQYELSEKINKIKDELKEVDACFDTKISQIREKIDESKDAGMKNAYKRLKQDTIHFDIDDKTAHNDVKLPVKRDNARLQEIITNEVIEISIETISTIETETVSVTKKFKPEKKDNLLDGVDLQHEEEIEVAYDEQFENDEDNEMLDLQNRLKDQLDKDDGNFIMSSSDSSVQSVESCIERKGFDDGEKSSDEPKEIEIVKETEPTSDHSSFFERFERVDKKVSDVPGEDLEKQDDTDKDNSDDIDEHFEVNYEVYEQEEEVIAVRMLDDVDAKRLEEEHFEREKQERQRILQNQEEMRLREFEVELEQKRQLMEAEERDRQMKLEAELEQKRIQQERDENERRLKLELELEHKRQLVEAEEKERQRILEIELENKRVKSELEHREKLAKLERELEARRYVMEQQEKEREFQLEKELDGKRLQFEKEENERLMNLEIELQNRRKKLEEEEIHRLKNLEAELEEKRLRQEADEYERRKKFENEMQNHFYEQEAEMENRLKQLENEIRLKRLAMETEERERREKLLKELDEKSEKMRKEEDERLKKLKAEEERLQTELEQEKQERLQAFLVEEQKWKEKLEEEERDRLERIKNQESKWKSVMKEEEHKRLMELKAEEEQRKKQIELEELERLKQFQLNEDKRRVEIELEEKQRRSEWKKEEDERRKNFESEEQARLKRMEDEEMKWRSKVEQDIEQQRLRIRNDEDEMRRKFETERIDLLKQLEQEETRRKQNLKKEEENLKRMENMVKEKLAEIERVEMERLNKLEKEEKKRMELLELQETELKRKLEREEAERLAKIQTEIQEIELKRKKEEQERETLFKKRQDDQEKLLKDLETERKRTLKQQEDECMKRLHEEEEKRRSILKREEEEMLMKLKEEERKRREQLDKETEERRRQLQQNEEIELRKAEEKLKIEQNFKHVCDDLNRIKCSLQDISDCSAKTYDEQMAVMDDCEREFQLITVEINDLKAQNEAVATNLTQYDLIKSFYMFLCKQFDEVRLKLSHKKQDLVKLSECEKNLSKYINLAENLIKKNFKQTSYVQSQLDLSDKLKTVCLIEESIRKFIDIIQHINASSLYLSDKEKLNLNLKQIEDELIKPLTQNCAYLESIDNEWKKFDLDYESLKKFLDIEFDAVVKITGQDKGDVNDELLSNPNLDLNFELNKYTDLKLKLNQKMPHINEIISNGFKLFNEIYAPNLSKELNETSELVNEISLNLHKRCLDLTELCKLNEQLNEHDVKVQGFKNDFYVIELSSIENPNLNLRENMQKLIEFKKELKQIDNNISCLPHYDILINKKIDIDVSMKNFGKQIDLLEMRYQKEILNNLQSRNSIIEMNEWIKEKYRFFNELSSSLIQFNDIGEQCGSSANHLIDILKENYEKFQHLNEEILLKERALKTIHNSIEIEIKQGFYDITICEQFSKLDSEFKNLKEINEKYLNYLNYLFIKLNEFNKYIYDIELWLQQFNEEENILTQNQPDQFVNLSLSNKNNANSDAKNLNITEKLQLFKIKIENLEQLYIECLDKKNEQNDQQDDFDEIRLKFKNLFNNYIKLKLTEIKLNFSIIEKYLNRKLEKKLFELKTNYFDKIKSLKKSIQIQFNFLLNGKLITLHQYEATIDNMRNEKESLEKIKLEMFEAFRRFETDEACNINFYEFDGELDFNGLKEQYENMVKFSQNVIVKWKQFEAYHAKFECEFNRIHSNLIDLNLFMATIENDRQVNKKFDLCKYEEKLNENLNLISFDVLNEILIDLNREFKCLFEYVENVNTKNQLNKIIEIINEQHKNLLEFNESLRLKSIDFFNEYNIYIDLCDQAKLLIDESNQLIDAFNAETHGFLTNNADQLQYLNKFNKHEIDMRKIIEKFLQFNITNTHRIEHLYELMNVCDEQIRHIKEKQKKIIENINENKYRLKNQLNDIDSNLNYLTNKYTNIVSKIDFTSTTRLVQNFDQYIECLVDIQENYANLIDYRIQLETITQQLDQKDKDEKYLKKITDTLSSLLKHIDFVQSNGFLNKLKEFNEVIKKILKFEIIDAKVENEENSSTDELKFLSSRFNNIKELLLSKLNDENEVLYVSKRKFCDLIENCEWKINEILLNTQTINEKYLSYRLLSIDIDKRLITVEEKLNSVTTTTMSMSNSVMSQTSIIEVNDYNFNFNCLESQYTFFTKLKAKLQDEQLRKNLNYIYELGCDLHRQCQFTDTTQMDILKSLENLPHYETLRVKYLDLTYRLDVKLKEFESELSNWKYVAKKSRRLLDLITVNYKLLKEITNKNGNNSVDSKVLQNKSELYSIINKLKYDILENLYKNNYIKDEILDLISKSGIKSSNINDMVEKILQNWTKLIDKVNRQIDKYELLNKKISSLDLSLNKLNNKITVLEVYLNSDYYKDFHIKIFSYKEILCKHNELKNLLHCLHEQNDYVLNLLNYTAVNVSDQAVIKSLNERWVNLKALINTKQIELENLWLNIQDIREQIEKCHVILDKTETFYMNNFTNRQNKEDLKFINNLYVILNDDYKIIKYLNESYMNVISVFGRYALFDEDNLLKQKIVLINQRWDCLHNEIGVKIKHLRQRDSLMSVHEITKESFNLWLNEIELMITNLEYLSTKELQLKYNDLQDLKQEVCEHADKLMHSEQLFIKKETFRSLMDCIKRVLKRIARLDSYINASVAKQRSTNQSFIESSTNYELKTRHSDNDDTLKYALTSISEL